jgi:hypothetical protein
VESKVGEVCLLEEVDDGGDIVDDDDGGEVGIVGVDYTDAGAGTRWWFG